MEMPNRNSRNGEKPTAILRRSPRFFHDNQAVASITVRRSPRFLHNNQTEPEVLQTPITEHGKSRASFVDPASFISTRKASLKAVQNSYSEVRNVLIEPNIGFEVSAKQNKGSRRYQRLNAGVEGFSCVRRSLRLSENENAKLRIERIRFDEFKKEGNNSREQLLGNKVKRVTRSSSQRIGNEKPDNGTCTGFIDCEWAKFLDKGDSSDKQTVEVGTYLSKQSVAKIEKKMTGNSNQGNADKHTKKSGSYKPDRFVECSKAEFLDKGASLIADKKAKLEVDSSKQVTMGAHNSRDTVGVGEEREGRGVEKQQKLIGVKRKRNQVEKGHRYHGIVQGWNKDQELALERAYFAVKPTPHFWKAVAKMVPGKSAQDCFNKIHSDHLTPPQPQPRSRTKTTNLSSLSLSTSKLLDSTGPKIKKPRCTTRKTRLVQKTVRQLLQKQFQVEQDRNADLFSVLEPTLSQSTEAFQQGLKFSTPDRNQEKPELFKRCQERSLSARRKQFSRFNSSSGATLASPPVLKQVKNKALHEKYIDQLHNREAKRKAASAKAVKSSLKIVGKESNVQKMNAIEAAKNALLLDARDAISQFQHVQANALSNFSDTDDDAFYEDEGEDRL